MKKIISFLLVLAAFHLSGADFETLKEDVLTVEVNPEGEWTKSYLKKFAKEHAIKIHFIYTPTNGAWEHPGQDKADIAAHNLIPREDRNSEGATYTDPFLYVLRSLEIRRSDIGKYETIHDFIGKTVAAPKGTTAEEDLRRRAPKGVKIITVDNFWQGYNLLYHKKIEAFAVGYYDLPDYVDYPQTYYPIDIHPLDPDHPESLHFLVRDKSYGLLEELNIFISENRYPLSEKE